MCMAGHRPDGSDRVTVHSRMTYVKYVMTYRFIRSVEQKDGERSEMNEQPKRNAAAK